MMFDIKWDANTSMLSILVFAFLVAIVPAWLSKRAQRRDAKRNQDRMTPVYEYRYVTDYVMEFNEQEVMNHWGMQGYRLFCRHPDPNNINQDHDYVTLVFELKVRVR